MWWGGSLDQNYQTQAKIVWTKSTMRLGWSSGWNKTIESPPLAEQLRAAPWIIHPLDSHYHHQ
jgi:hypothetical protein